MDQQHIQITPEVIAAINEELDYQNSMAGSDRANIEDNGLAGQLVTLDTYTRRAADRWTKTNGNEAALHELRKVAAVAIRALVRFGCPRREQNLTP